MGVYFKTPQFSPPPPMNAEQTAPMLPPPAKQYGFKFFLRYRYKDEAGIKQFLDFVSSRDRKYLACLEVGEKADNTHLHVLMTCTRSKSKWAEELTEFRQATNQGGQEFITSKAVTSEPGVIRYVCKGENRDTPPVIRQNLDIPESVIATWHRQYYEEGSKNPFKRKNEDSMDLSIRELRDKCVKRCRASDNLVEVIKVVVDECKGRYMHRQQYVSMCNAVRSIQCPDQWSSNMVNEIHRTMTQV